MDKNKKLITRIFGKTSRGKYHIMRRATSTYCRGTAVIIRMMHIENLPAASICKHCVKVYNEERRLYEMPKMQQ